jgi:hypothetical protein
LLSLGGLPVITDLKEERRSQDKASAPVPDLFDSSIALFWANSGQDKSFAAKKNCLAAKQKAATRRTGAADREKAVGGSTSQFY